MTTLVTSHNAGFFSCCSVKLHQIIEYFNHNKMLPDNVDSSRQFAWYKINDSNDITFDYFEHYNKSDSIIKYVNNIDYNHEHQFINYSKLDYNNICPFIKKYFSPSNEVQSIIKKIEDKYNMDYNNICVLFYRGNDKNRETQICGYDEYVIIANKILATNPNIKFLIQSDETEFIEKMFEVFPGNTFYFKDEIRHMRKCNYTVDLLTKKHIDLFSKYYLAITIIMSKCKYIVCGSGNCSIWIMFYRENNNNVYQNFNGEWINPA
jgi:hypothetical protein